MTRDPFILLPEHMRPIFRDNPERFAVLDPHDRTVLVEHMPKLAPIEAGERTKVARFWKAWPNVRNGAVLLIIWRDIGFFSPPVAEYWTPCHELAEALIRHMLALAEEKERAATEQSAVPAPVARVPTSIVTIDGVEYVRLPSKEAFRAAWNETWVEAGSDDARRPPDLLYHWLKTRELP